jgi:hypothetical protein
VRFTFEPGEGCFVVLARTFFFLRSLTMPTALPLHTAFKYDLGIVDDFPGGPCTITPVIFRELEAAPTRRNATS